MDPRFVFFASPVKTQTYFLKLKSDGAFRRKLGWVHFDPPPPPLYTNGRVGDKNIGKLFSTYTLPNCFGGYTCMWTYVTNIYN